MVTSVDIYKSIRALQLEGVTSQRAAAKILGISRNTVKKYWMGDAVPWDRKAYQREASVITPEVKQFIEHCLDTDAAEGVKKQRHTARRIYNRLVEEFGYTGSESAIRAAVHEAKAERKENEVFIPLRFAPGQALQIDWGEATVKLVGEKVKVNLFCARMSYSCAPYVIAYWRQNLESFLDAIIHTLNYFGGVPRSMIFDNARVAVKSGFGAHAAAQDDYSKLAAHYGFQPVFCNPASGNEKGLVENLVGYIRRNVCMKAFLIQTISRKISLMWHLFNIRYQETVKKTYTGGTGLTQLLHSLENYAEAHKCYFISGKRGLWFFQDEISTDGYNGVGFNKEHNFFEYRPSENAIAKCAITIPGTAYNLTFIFPQDMGDNDGDE